MYRYKKIGYVFFYSLLCFLKIVAQPTPASVLSKYITFKSISGNEKPAGEYIKSVCEEFGLYVTIFSNTDSSYNFCASLKPITEKFPSVLLINHLDVVPVDMKTKWEHEPFSGDIVNDTIHGRGAIDTKGLAVMQLFALKALKDRLLNTYIKHNAICYR